jgi:hypothetical protein
VGLLAPLRASDTPIGDIHVTALGSRRYAPWLWVLAALFCARVIAQPIALVFHPGFLPPFDAWHSAVLPYQLLLASQGIILFWLAWTAVRFSTAAVTPNRRIGVNALILGTLYVIRGPGYCMAGLAEDVVVVRGRASIDPWSS